MSTTELKLLIDTASSKIPADLVLKNCHIVNVFTHTIEEGDIAIKNGVIAGVGSYTGTTELDMQGLYALPGLIESHIHIESSMVTPEEFARVVVSHGTTTAICDPHEIVNVAGTKALDYMLKAAEKTALSIYYMIPSCVPCTDFEDSGAALLAKDMQPYLKKSGIGGIGEFMNAPGVINTDEKVLEKINMAHEENALIDGHAPGLLKKPLAAYAAARIKTDHECGTVEEMLERLKAGMYVQLRYGSACRELPLLLKGVTEYNARRCLLCSDDRQSLHLLEDGDIDDCLRVCVKNGLDPVTAVTMATLNAAECYGLSDRGAIAPGRRADITLVSDLCDFDVKKVFIAGELVAENGRYLKEGVRHDPGEIKNSMNVADFSVEKLRMTLSSPRVRVIDVLPDTVLTRAGEAEIKLSEENDFVFDESAGVARIASIERHRHTGKVANAFIRGYGIKKGAIALSIGHDSHNILVVGVSKEEMAFAVESLIAQKGGIVLSENETLLASLALPIGGLMSDRRAQDVRDSLLKIRKTAIDRLGVNREIDPIMTLCFMSLPVIPDLKLTDRGLFDVKNQRFVPVELDG